MNSRTLFRALLATAIVVLASMCIVPVAADGTDQAAYAPDHILVRFQDTANSDSILAATPSSEPVEVIGDFSNAVSGLQVIQLPEGFTVEEAVAYYSAQPGVVYAEPDYYFTLNAVPNDPGYSEQWGLKNPSAKGGVSAEEAWDITTGDNSVVVAVIDTGVDIEHPDLKAHIWTNPGEIPKNGIDDDGNGKIDDVHGWNFITQTNDVTDYKGHGTHCAGIIGAVTNNEEGVAGMAWDVTIMPVAVMNAAGRGAGSSILEGIIYAVDNKADILSMSLGGYSKQPSQAYRDTINYAEKNGVLIVASAGNEKNDNDKNPAWPASFPNDNIISVAANDDANDRAVFSNYGATTVDLAAPGVDIYSTIPVVSKTPGELNPADNPKFAQIGSGWHTVETAQGKYSLIRGVNSSVICYTDPIIPAGKQFTLGWTIVYNVTEPKTLQYLVSTRNFTEYTDIQDMLAHKSEWEAFGYNQDLYTDYQETWGGLWSDIIEKLPSPDNKYYLGIYYDSKSPYDTAVMVSTTIGNDYRLKGHTWGLMSGTSMAAPMVSGAAALIKSVNPDLTPSEIREILIATVDKLDQWDGKVVSGGRMNIAAALKYVLNCGRAHSPSLPKEYTTPSYVEPMVQQTTTPTAQPTPTPAAPTVMPTVKPTTQATQKSPAPLAGLIAGLGAAAVVLGVRKLRKE